MALHDLELTSDGRLRTYPQTAPIDLQMDLEIVAGKTPIQLVVSLSDYRRLSKLAQHPKCLMSEDARELINIALEAGKKVARPITKPTDYELMAYVEEVKKLKCIQSVSIPAKEERGDLQHGFPDGVPDAGMELTAGKEYEFISKKLEYIEPFTKPKYTFDESTQQIGARIHQMSFKGNDYALQFRDDRGWNLRFRGHPTIHTDVDESLIWDYFERPHIPTLADENKKAYETAKEILKYMEEATSPKFNFFPGQMEYIASASCSDSALISAETGCGKTLIAIALIMLKAPGRTLVCAPKGTVKTDDKNTQAQWVSEFKKFAPGVEVHNLFSIDDYYNLLEDHGGKLPYGVFLTYDHSMFRTGLEHIPGSWVAVRSVKDKETGKIKKITPDPEAKYRDYLNARGFNLPPVRGVLGARHPINYHHGIGHERILRVMDKGAETGEKWAVRCISEPCMSTEIGNHQWDMVILDEAHCICNLDAQITKNFLRLQPKYKFALTATPIPNMIWNIFSLMGWLSVPNWYYGDRANANWPYKLDELSGRGGFQNEFVTREIDHTQSQMNIKAGRGPSSSKLSPKISQEPKLLKLLRPKVAFISKNACNPNLPKANIMKIEVPMSKEQRMNYSHFMNPANIATKDRRFRYGVQMAYLRGISANPHSVKYNIHASTDFTPKTLAVMETAYTHIKNDEQVLIVTARREQLAELEKRFAEAKIKTSMIHGEISDKAKEASDFKSGKTQVMLMSIKCAQALSFEQCKNMIIASLEWSYGVLNQAMGRIYRVNSPQDINVYVMLHKDSLENLMFDKLGTKEDAATIALYGKKVPKEVLTTDDQSVLAEHVLEWDKLKGLIESTEETEKVLLGKWAKLRDNLLTITQGEELGITEEDKSAVNELLEEMEDLLG